MHEFGKCRRVRAEAADEVVDVLRRIIPVDMAELARQLRRRLQHLRALDEASLDTGFNVLFNDALHGSYHEFRACRHHLVMQCSGRIFRCDRTFLTEHDTARIDILVDHECSDACHSLAVYHRPVDRGRATVLRQKCRMEVEGSELRHGPDFLRKHPECHHHEKVSIESRQLLQEFRIFQLHRLKDRYALLHGEFLDCTFIDLQSPAARLVSDSHDADDIVACVNEGLQGSDCKLRRSHIYYSRLLEYAHDFALYLSPP